ncbi:serine hydrolase [Devosia sp.]|uniref:serine hydrolase n=1 Tax=Devosia sp. TaxID=1871048 RepID=UPI002F2251DF
MVSQAISALARWSTARIVMAVMLALVVLVPSTAAASSVPRKYAGIVVDAKSGKVLYESAADAARYPASVTKVMTLYVLFQELAAGNIKLSDKMVVSRHAAAAVPTKLGLPAGSKIKVEDAIKALVTLSANDMARVIAEHISGTESEFAKRMTATAKALGMSRTTYRNASGLPDSKQVTTVRDQAILGVAIYQHFPKYYEYFQTKSFSYGKRTYGNHNRLLGSNHVDGIKTGYTRASGFNLLTAARDADQHIVVVGFGFDKSGSRDAKVRELVKKYFPQSRKGSYLDTAMIPVPGRKGAVVQVAVADPVVPRPYPAFRNAVAPAATVAAARVAQAPDPAAVQAQLENPVIVASMPTPAPRPADLGFDPAVQAANMLGGASASQAAAQDRPLDVIGAWLSETFSLGAAPAPLGQTAPSAPLLPPVGIGESGEPIDLMTSGGSGNAQPAAVPDQPAPAPLQVAAVETPAPAAEPAAPGWVVQIGAAPTESGANSLLAGARDLVGGLDDLRPYVERFEKNGQVFFRARFTGFGGRDDATAVCKQLKQAKMSCLAMQS